MSKQKLLSLFFFFLSAAVLAQNTTEQEYVGTLQLSTNDIISVKINFTQSPNGTIEGTSITDIYGADRTKSKITGRVNSKNNSISFKEISNISTKSSANKTEFCFIEVNNASMKKTKSKSMITGSFVGKYANGRKCASGTLYLINSSYLDKITKQYVSPKQIKNADSLNNIKQKVKSYRDKSEKNTLQAQELLTVNWTSNEIIMEVWDGDQEDQDEIGIFLDDQKILDQFVLKQQKKTIVVPFTSQVSVLKIVGLDEGASYPCTANVLLRDGNNTTAIVTILKKGETTSVRLTKSK